MNVVLDDTAPTATKVWFDPQFGTLSVEIDSAIASIEFARIPKTDFESTASVSEFSLGCQGAVVICHHRDGAETWLPVDMWLPGGFTPVS